MCKRYSKLALTHYRLQIHRLYCWLLNCLALLAARNENIAGRRQSSLLGGSGSVSSIRFWLYEAEPLRGVERK